MTIEKLQWRGKTCRCYTYEIYPIGTSFNEVPGNYIYAKQTATGWVPCYIGQAKSLGARLGNHEKEPSAKRHGATHIHAHQTQTEAERLAEEADLIRYWQPPCNEQIP
jgi:hypothetical protein